MPFFRLKPGQDILSKLPTTADPFAPKSMLYPWASYRGNASNLVIQRHGAVSSWENLKDYALAYRTKGITFSSAGRATMSPVSTPIDGNAFSFLHKVRVLPVIARIQWVFSHTAGTPTPVSGQPPAPAGSLEPRLLLTPVITMWNPFNVEMTFSNVPLRISIERPLPVALRYTIDGVANTKYNSISSRNANNTPSLSSLQIFYYQITSAFTLKPGETRLFSPDSGSVSADAVPSIVMKPGYRSNGGHYFILKNDAGQNVVAPPTATIKADAKFDTAFNDLGLGVGVFVDMVYGGKIHLAYRMNLNSAVAGSVYHPLDNLSTSNPLSNIQNNPTPFMTTIFGARMASKTNIAAKGFVQSSPFVNFTTMGGKDLADPSIARHYGGTNHPVNSPFDYSFEKIAPAGDSLLPNEDASTNRGYIVTGFNKADGLSRCVIAELPTRPLQSLAELQNWDLRYENPVPPFSFNIIGNSDASPLVASNSVTGSYSDAVNLQHDDSYCANHLLFDDWFFSSIAPNPTNFGIAGKTIHEVFTEFVTNSNSAPLGNHAYKPLSKDASYASVSSSNADELFTLHAAKSNSWRTIASRLEVEGMFNVNSTSLSAWRALLGHARGQKTPYINDEPASWEVDLSARSDYPFSRFSVAGDTEAKSQGSSGAFPEAAEFAGYRNFDDATLDVFAQEIVKQVRLRGPFLSLSEFINRQLSSGNLALAGTVQAALDELAKTNSTNPYSVMMNVIPKRSAAVQDSAATAEYKFPEAAEGPITYGLPGWTRQADVLRPLAPILTVRDDTFTVRAYGDARDSKGKITATATCEAVVRRTRDYVDPADSADITTTPISGANQTFGRIYQIVSFRWLRAAEL